MGLIQVEPGQLQTPASQLGSVGRRISELSAGAGSKFCLGAPAATSASLTPFQVRWSGIVDDIGEAVAILGAGLSLASVAYRDVDASAMPAAPGP
jgi:hypothetical protein